MEKTEKIEQLIAQRQKPAQGLGLRGKFIKGSLAEYSFVCGRKDRCRCGKGKKHGPYLYLSVYRDGKQTLVYIPKPMRRNARKWVGNLQKIRERISQISQLNLQILELSQAKSKKDNIDVSTPDDATRL